ncbi:Uncharacterised protein [uncultured archaeon]|nr:Uncharacterised protein [uncultured archaeon]
MNDTKKYINFLDLLIILLWVGFMLMSVAIPSLGNSPIRTFLGIPMVLFIPGYVTVAALYPRNNLEPVVRIALSLGLSIVVIPILGLILNFTFGLNLISVINALCIYIITVVFIAINRIRKLPEDLQFSISFNKLFRITDIELNSKNMANSILAIILIFTIGSAADMAYLAITTPKIGERFTEFYVLDGQGKADNYPIELKLNSSVDLMAGVVNHEYVPTNYTIQMVLDKELLTTEKLSLNDTEKWEKKIILNPNKEGFDMKLQFLLFKENNFTIPYRKLYLFINCTS